jgi:tetratricopeptide (TPR) repeat protein
MWIVRLCILIAAVIVVPTTSWADKKTDKVARAHFEKGKKLAAKSKFAEAYAEFEAGYAANPLPAFLFNMGEAARGMGNVEKARTAYEQFLAAEQSGQLADAARARLVEIEKANPKPPPAPVEPPPAATPPPAPAPAPVAAPTPKDAAASFEDKSNKAAVTKSAEPKSSSKPLWKKWPVWAAVGAAVATGIVIGIVVTSDGGGGVMCSTGCIDLRD